MRGNTHPMENIKLEVTPNFIAEDNLGNQIDLKRYKNKKHVLLVFNRGFF